MSRLTYFRSNPKRTLTALTGVLAASAVAVGSGADFSAQTANPGNAFTAGTLTMSNDKEAAALLTASNLKPGGVSQPGTVDIGNTGSLGGDFTLDKGAISNKDKAGANDTASPIAEKIKLTVVDCGVFSGSTAPTCDTNDTKVVDGAVLSSFTSQNLGAYAAGAKHRYQFTVQLDSSAGDPYQGEASTVEFVWNAKQN